MEADEAELARAAAALARLTAPAAPNNSSGGVTGDPMATRAGTGAAAAAGQGEGREEPFSKEEDEMAGPAAVKVKSLKQQVQELWEDVQTGLTDDEALEGEKLFCKEGLKR
jgi:hypothetical protein